MSNLLKKSPEFFYYAALLVIIWIGTWIRTRNLPLIREGWLPADPDSALFLRYMQTIVEQGSLPIMDNLRFVPLGFNTLAESRLLAHVLAYIYKVLSVFSSGISVARVDMLYPIILFPFIIIAFFFLIKKIFDWRVALVASAFLAVMAPFLQRTMLGFSDKEPLGIFFFFTAFYFLVSGLREQKLKPAVIYGLLAGAFTGLLGLTWGAVSFAFMIIGLSFLTMILFGNFKKKDFAVYLALLVSMTPILLTSGRFSMVALLTSPVQGIIYFPLLAFVIYFYLQGKLKEKTLFKLPNNVSSILIAGLISIAGLIFLKGFGIIQALFSQVKLQLLHPFGVVRLTLTVAENQQPFISTWIGSFGYLFWLMILGAVLLSFLIFSEFSKKYKYPLIVITSIFIFSLVFSRYKPDSIFNGTNAISQFVFFGGMFLMAGALVYTYIRAFYKDEETLECFKRIDKVLIFTLIWFAWVVIGARGAIRLLFLFTPVVAVLGALALVKAGELGLKFKDNLLKIGVVVIIIIFGLSLFNGFVKAGAAQTTGSFPHLHPQWTDAMNWVKGNTISDAVFAHWWDYGYWIQTAGERATVLDGGNAIPYWDHLMGRFVLTSPNDREALEFLYTHKVTHLLIDPSDIGKYPAYSTIGSDENYDRFSWIHSFSLDAGASQETRDGTIFIFQAGTPLDEDFEWQGEVFSSGDSFIGGALLPTIQQENSLDLKRPTIIIIKNGQRVDVPLNCVFFNGQLSEFGSDGLDGCLHIVPTVTQDGRFVGFSNAFYLSPRTRRSLMVRLYIFGMDHPNFRLVYPQNPTILDVEGIGRVAPIKIWEVIYPEDIQTNPIYLEKFFPTRELELDRGYY